MGKRILVSWIGNTDLEAAGVPVQRRRAGRSMTPNGTTEQKHSNLGPIRSLLNHVAFDEIHLLSNDEAAKTDAYVKWLGKGPRVQNLTLNNPADHAEILERVRPFLSSLNLRRTDDLSFHLTPGTPQMAAIWLLLGKSQFPATLYQTSEHQSKPWITNIPFHISDALPALTHKTQETWQNLTAESPDTIRGFEKIIGDSPALRGVVDLAKRAALFDVSVLITGEPGTGKELFADAIHQCSKRREAGKLESLNCASIPEDLMESELFGWVKGAHSTANKDRKGAFKSADKKTLFLDEVGEMNYDVQAKLLRVLQPTTDAPCKRFFRPLGSDKDESADVRIIAATNRNLLAAVGEGRFREDLLYRLNTITIELPPLRDRGDDSLIIAEHLLGEINRRFTKEAGDLYKQKTLSNDARSQISTLKWPGNIRQLYNALLQSAVMSDKSELTAEDIAAATSTHTNIIEEGILNRPLGSGFIMDDIINEVKEHYCRRALNESGNNKQKAAKLVNLARSTFNGHLSALGLD